MDFCRSLCGNALVGYGMAAALLSGCDCHSDVAISCCDVGLWNDSRLDRAQRIWIESAKPTACDTRAYRHAARARDFSDRLGDLAKIRSETGWGLRDQVYIFALL